MIDLPPGLEAFGARLRQAAEREVAERRRALRRQRARRVALPVVAAVVAASVSAGAVNTVDRDGPPIPSRGVVGASFRPAKDPTVVQASAAKDPAGGPPWVVRAYTNARGRECVDVGQLLDGVFGQQHGGRFGALSSREAGTCAPPGGRGPLFAIMRRPLVDLTLVYGLAVDQAPVTIDFVGRVQRVQPAGFGAFVAVFSGAGPGQPAVVRSRVRGRADVRYLG